MKFHHVFAIAGVMLTAWIPAQAASELEQLRALVAEQERQIRMLEEENSRLKVDAALRASRNVQGSGVNLVSMPKAAPTTAQTVESTASNAEYTVVAGDNLARIGRNFGVSVDAIAMANGIGEDMIIRPGQKLKIPNYASTKASAPPTATVADASSPKHTVVAGETFYSISRQHNVTLERLMATNPDTKPAALRVGQKIRIPDTAAAETAETAETAGPNESTEPAVAATPATTEVPEIQTEAAAPARENRRPVHTMKIDGEMSYGAFAAKHGTTTERLNQLNGLDLDGRTVLAKGSELYVPAHP